MRLGGAAVGAVETPLVDPDMLARIRWRCPALQRLRRSRLQGVWRRSARSSRRGVESGLSAEAASWRIGPWLKPNHLSYDLVPELRRGA